MATARSEGKPVLITSAEKSQDEQLHDRKVRYVLLMGTRVVLLIVATVLVMAEAPLLWVWIPLCVAGGALLPWVAVLVANDRPPKEQHRMRSWLRRTPSPDDPRALTQREHQVVDPDE
ncbi:DUF3099 domain-containing protein [Phytomonospora sp. NPDC050363]|uniref:DUF3099 domain-containing protein n=1 Tax=Phytomonospora sp. NPDC050363 TaxID=3155642 RepID=UPI0033EB8A44